VGLQPTGLTRGGHVELRGVRAHTHCLQHPLGFRGGGEPGITPALGVIINVIVDALADLGVTRLEMPVTPERVWRALCRQVKRIRGRVMIQYFLPIYAGFVIWFGVES
jgi:uncharacterized protein YjiS (DUF1127 family)